MHKKRRNKNNLYNLIMKNQIYKGFLIKLFYDMLKI